MKAKFSGLAVIATLGLIINCMPTVFVADGSAGSPAFEFNICQPAQMPLHSISFPVLLSHNQQLYASELIFRGYNSTAETSISPLSPAAPDPPPPKAAL
jgi:hypothetical protein